jgi:non-ribosomal peptide synthetase component F
METVIRKPVTAAEGGIGDGTGGIGTGKSTESGSHGYWEKYLGGTPALELPTDHPRPAILTSKLGVDSCIVGPELLQGLDRLSQEAGIDSGTAGAALFSVLLYRYTAQEQFVLGVANGAGRELPVVVDFSGQPSFRRLLSRIETAFLNGSKAGVLPADLSERFGIDPDLSRHPVFQVAFSTRNADGGSPPRLLALPGTPGLDLDLELARDRESSLGESSLGQPSRREPSLRLQYNEDLFTPATAERMLNHLRRLLAGVVENADLECAQLPMLTDPELRELLVERNDTARDFPKRCLHEDAK